MGHMSLLKRIFSPGRRRSDGEASDVGSTSSRCDEASSSYVEALPRKPTWRCFPFDEIYLATNGFHPDNLVGRGGHAEVYRGVLKNGQVVAVKRLATAASDEQKEKEFLTELGTIGHVRHPNISALLGCCIDQDLHLIFEFSSHGSVASQLHDDSMSTMSWKVRYKIAVGAARGLHYLHKGCQRRIIHRDIKASNILLTAEFEPQISDFGLARWLPTEWIHRAVAPIEGTFGCLAPEYFMHGIVDEKTDVFAFGVFLLEIISGRKPVHGSHQSLITWGVDDGDRAGHLHAGDAEMLVDPKLAQDYDSQELSRVVFVASLCTRPSATWRPSMTEVVELLGDGEIEKERWGIPEDAAEEDHFWGFDDLEEGVDDDDDDLGTSFSSLSSSTGSS